MTLLIRGETAKILKKKLESKKILKNIFTPPPSLTPYIGTTLKNLG
jgi:hypothetical protein